MTWLEMDDIPDSLIERIEMMEGILIASATNGVRSDPRYSLLRRELMAMHNIKGLLPDFVRMYRNLEAFWPYIQDKAETYAERRQFISAAFTPLMDRIEDLDRSPSDKNVSDSLTTFDADGVHAIWSRALERRASDPEGAITIARTLLETVCKRILDELEVSYNDKAELPKLYAMAAEKLNLAPNQHTQEPIKAILGGTMNVVNGLGTLRNRLSDSHGRGGSLPVRPSARHASLAVNMAGAVATFLVETFNEQK